tara:strand:+ start:1476 stop:1958 length:483 start_codon:yes stop_codon:yes gene_type:complete
MSIRKTFLDLLLEEMSVNSDIYLITADLGWKQIDDHKDRFPERVINVGAAEQLMVGVGVGLALEKKIPVLYTMTPFLLYRPFEFIRNFLERESIPVKLLGIGRDKDYDWLGFTHWAHDDKIHLEGFKNIEKMWPKDESETTKIFKDFMYSDKPSYVSLKR